LNLICKKLASVEAAKAYRTACIAELHALKPGNVHLFADGHGMTIHVFIKSADASASVIAQADLTLGERIYQALKATNDAVGMNTNLGVILLCAPLIHVALHGDTSLTMQQNLEQFLAATTVDDTLLVSQAIVLANPAGLGKAEVHDVRVAPQVYLLELMSSAQDKDRIAWQYAHTFADIEFGVEVYTLALDQWQNAAWATTALYLALLARYPDTHIIRKYGIALAENITAEAQDIEKQFRAAENPKTVQRMLMDWDASLKTRGINPGTSADLTVASLLAYALVQ
jgi:triphosphoribosyl-dephospho-CoA synthase